MTPTPPSSSEGTPLPPRHRPVLGDLSKDTTEIDLWDFDDDFALPDAVPGSKPDAARGSGDIPSPREKKPEKSGGNEDRPPKLPVPGEEKIRMNVNKARQSTRPSGAAAGQSKPESDFDDLDHWVDEPSQPEVEELPAEVLPVRSLADEPEKRPEELIPEPEVAVPAVESKLSGETPADDEFAPVVPANARPVSLRPHLGLSKVERAGLIFLLLLLMAVAAVVYMFSLNRLPREAERARANDFPIRGSLVTVTKASSYWRAPITEGPDADTFRRGTELLPVLEIELSGGPAAVRVLFRNEDRTFVGDAVTRSIKSGASLKIAATAGFDDPGMHAAYRTGESKPWTIEVLEAPSEDAAGKDFKKVFEMNISTDLR